MQEFSSRMLEEFRHAMEIRGRSVKPILSMITGLAEYEKKLGRPVLEFTKDNFIDFLSQYQGTNRRSMRNQKSYLNTYLEWLMERGYPSTQAVAALDPVTYDDLSLDHAFSKYYFRDFDSLKSHLFDRVDEALEGDYVDPHVFDTQIAALFLAWFGLRKADVLSLKKADLPHKSNCLLLSSAEVELPGTVMDFLRFYAGSDGFERIKAKNKRYVEFCSYKPSEYLLRSIKSDRLTDNALRSSINTLNVVDPLGKAFSFSKVYWSGVFSRLHGEELTGGRVELPAYNHGDKGRAEFDRVKRILADNVETDDQIRDRMKEYEKYKSYFWPDE